MKIVQIPKRSGGTRTICVPSSKLKRQLRLAIPHLQRVARQECDPDVVHGFIELRSPVTNAARHVGYRYTLSMDLKDFFDCVKKDEYSSRNRRLGTHRHCRQFCELAQQHGWRLWHNGVARQGLPTSPILANIAAAPMDRDILEWMKARCGVHSVYTRYADDLTFSYDEPLYAKDLMEWIPRIAAKHGFTVNAAKTQLQDAQRGRRIITGVAVDDTGLHPTRAAKRRMRAALHNAKTGKTKHWPARQWMRHAQSCRRKGVDVDREAWLRRWLWKRFYGQREWCALKPPKVGRRSAWRIGEAFKPAEALAEMSQRRPC